MEQPGGKEARAFLSSLISNRWVELAILLKSDTGGIVDRHGRIVCVPYLRHDSPVEVFARSPYLPQNGNLREGQTFRRNIELEWF
jgi:hypothetical protein